MDRLNARGVPFAAPQSSDSGWDSKTVWRERVKEPRPSADREAPITVLPEQSAGWDPLETWRIRVQHARRDAK